MNTLFLSKYAIWALETGRVRQDVEIVHKTASNGAEGATVRRLETAPAVGDLPFHFEHNRRREQTRRVALLNAQPVLRFLDPALSCASASGDASVKRLNWRDENRM